MPKRRAKVRHAPTYDALDDKILAMYTSNPKPKFNDIKRKIPKATQSRIIRAVWRSKREAKMKAKATQAVATHTDNEPLSNLRAMVQRFVQEVSTHPDPIQDMSITITTPSGTVSVRMSQEVKPSGG